MYNNKNTQIYSIIDVKPKKNSITDVKQQKHSIIDVK